MMPTQRDWYAEMESRRRFPLGRVLSGIDVADGLRYRAVHLLKFI
ncbi:MAG TPA: hypothetical protein VFW73_10210 [Lacipirellulaceae bacterium]|nr:hypothetical protein [Lacipirellulaceae bacterium]